MRIFIGPYEIAGYYTQLASGFRALGIRCDFVEFTPHEFVYREEAVTPYLIRLTRALSLYRSKRNRSPIFRYLLAIPERFARLLYALFAIIRYDTFIFGFGHSLLWNNIDLPILKWLGKRVISNLAHGSEARPAYIDGGHQSPEGVPLSPDLIRIYSQKQKCLVHLHQKATVIVGAPFSTSYFADSRFINSCVLGLPFQSKDIKVSKAQTFDPIAPSSAKPIRILHAPSHPAAKGSPQIIQAIERLKARGHLIDLILLRGRPHAEVLEEIQRCDFVVDQIYSDTPVAGFAAEAGFFGKPAVVGGYGLEYLKTFVPEEMWPPSRTCHPDQIEQAIEFLIVNPDERLSLGAKAEKFVRQMWSPTEVAKRYLRLIEGDIPIEWWLDPRAVIYLEGVGQSVERTCENIRHMVQQYGIESLQLSHRPELERAFLDLAGIARQ